MRKRAWRRGRVLESKSENLGSRPGDVAFETIQFYRRSSTFVKVCRNSSIFIVKFSSGMSETLFDTCVFWSCVTRCGCRTTSSTLFTVYGRNNSLTCRLHILESFLTNVLIMFIRLKCEEKTPEISCKKRIKSGPMFSRNQLIFFKYLDIPKNLSLRSKPCCCKEHLNLGTRLLNTLSLATTSYIY